jgi:hypothetical protein
VSYDPALNKGFVDQRHLAMGTSPTTDSALNFVHIYANDGISRSLNVAISFSGVTDSGSYVYRYDDPSPAALDIQHALIGRDMTNAPLPSPGPTPSSTPVPTATPVVNATITPRPNATITPTPGVNATVTPTLAPSAIIVNNDTNVTAATGKATYNITGRITDAAYKAVSADATASLDGQRLTIDPQGGFCVEVANGTHELTISAPGFGSKSFTLTVSGADIVKDVQLSMETTGNSGGKSGSFVPGFEAIAALIGLLIIGLYRYGRA